MEIFFKNFRKFIHIIFTAIFIISLNYKNYKFWLKRAPKWPFRCSFVNQELVLKQLADLKEAISELLPTIQLPIPIWDLALSGLWGPFNTNRALSELGWALPKLIFCYLLFFLLFVTLGPYQRSGLNSMSSIFGSCYFCPP